MKKKRSESSPREKRIEANVLFTTPLTEGQRKQLQKLAAMPDTTIDYSDAPEVPIPSKVEIGRFYRPVKQLISLRVDADVLAWFKAQGPGYQTHINDVLRREAESQARS